MYKCNSSHPSIGDTLRIREFVKMLDGNTKVCYIITKIDFIRFIEVNQGHEIPLKLYTNYDCVITKNLEDRKVKMIVGFDYFAGIKGYLQFHNDGEFESDSAQGLTGNQHLELENIKWELLGGSWHCEVYFKEV